jgi:hypothetical protein
MIGSNNQLHPLLSHLERTKYAKIEATLLSSYSTTNITSTKHHKQQNM